MGIVKFILRPFAGFIRYGALKIMKKFRQPDDKRPVIAVSDHILNEIVLPSVFNVFRENKFRELARFKKLPVSEHDRIFNELESAGVCLAIFYLNTAKLLARSGDYHFWQDTEEHLSKQLQKILIGFGVDGSNAKLMRQLIEMRYAEYEELAKKVWDANDEVDKKTDFKSLPSEMKRIAAAIEATAIGTTDHIRRGEIEEKDHLIKYLIEWLLFLNRRIGRFIRNL